MPKPSALSKLGGPAEGGGYVFALLYSTGVVHVGRAQDARAELPARRITARQLGVALADWWVSEPMVQWIGRERDLAAACRDLGGRECGAGSFRGVDFAALCAIGQQIKADPAVSRRPAAEPDDRMAIAARLRAEGLSLRKSAGQMLVSYGTVRRDLARWDLVGHLMPPEVVRLSVPVTRPCYIGPGDSRPAPGDAGAPTADVTATCNEIAPVIPLRRSA